MPKSLTPYIIVAVIAVLGLILSEPAANWISRKLAPQKIQGGVVGKINQIQGEVKILREGQVLELPTPLEQPVSIHSGDRVEVDDKGQAILTLNSQDEFELLPRTAAVFTFWDERNPASPIYVTLLSGDAELRKAGVKEKAYLVRDGRLYLPGQKAAHRPMALTVLRSAPLDMHLAQDARPEDFEIETEPTSVGTEPKEFGAEPVTLSNEYIDEIISSRQHLLQKCWLARIKEAPEEKARLAVQFEITRRGKVKDVKIADSTVHDETFKNCVSAVFERLTFRSFSGPEISLSYPLQFE